MSDKEFFSNITYLLVKGVITREQHDWLDKERCKGWHNDPMSLDALDIFGGKMLK